MPSEMSSRARDAERRETGDKTFAAYLDSASSHAIAELRLGKKKLIPSVSPGKTVVGDPRREDVRMGALASTGQLGQVGERGRRRAQVDPEPELSAAFRGRARRLIEPGRTATRRTTRDTAGGAVIEVTLFRRMYSRAHFDFLLLTFAMSLVAEGAVREIWRNVAGASLSALPTAAPADRPSTHTSVPRRTTHPTGG